ncbi:hypothetical protein [Rubrivirga sp. IMCC45206]|uniref:hypothetical protein n=1 Tax=Rubrivirga sp. IMCC45206 TaxID=3391614 RepID=UPI00398FB2D2
MILRRLTQHVRDQNWTAVAIDFVIVVVGVFVGIQAQAWSAERGDRRLERVYLERLLADVDLSIETTAANQGRLREYSAGQVLVVASLQACALAEADRDAFADGIADLGKVGPSVFVLNTMDEMLSAGHFSLLQNPDVRDVLNGLARDRAYQQNVFEAVVGQLAPLTGVAWQRAVRLYPDARTPFGPVGWDELALDFDALCADTAFQGAVSQVRYLTDAGASLNDRALGKLRGARAALQAELAGRPLPPAAP